MSLIDTDGNLRVPALGLGTWRMGESSRQANAEIEALREGIALGLTVIDTAEMYGDGGAERVVGQAIAGQRERVTLVSKVLPSNASRAGVRAACDRSRRRLGVDRIDLYLLHWPGSVPLSDTIAGFEALQASGSIGAWGVSNFDPSHLRQVLALNAHDCAANQIYWSLAQRGPEFDSLPLHRAQRVATMAYSPLDQGRLLDHPALAAIAARHQATPAQVALAWLLAQSATIVIPKSGHAARVRENAAARELRLDAQDLRALDAAFPPPTRARPLAMI